MGMTIRYRRNSRLRTRPAILASMLTALSVLGLNLSMAQEASAATATVVVGGGTISSPPTSFTHTSFGAGATHRQRSST